MMTEIFDRQRVSTRKGNVLVSIHFRVQVVGIHKNASFGVLLVFAGIVLYCKFYCCYFVALCI